ncbi:MAG: YdeI/OmpD-associated family protein [Cypionkella sp.]
MASKPEAVIVTVQNRAALRAWLGSHHTNAQSVWLASYKRHHPDYLAYPIIVEELLCWGWIDGVTRAYDADRSMILIAPRNPKSGWSAVNKAHVTRARASGAMTPAGEAKIALALQNGMWDFLNDVDALIPPDDLRAALGDHIAGYDAYPKSVKRGTLEWIKSAKTAPTRAARIADVARSAALGLRPKPFRR